MNMYRRLDANTKKITRAIKRANERYEREQANIRNSLTNRKITDLGV